MNPQLYAARDSIAAAGVLQRQIHQDAALRLLIPNLPRNPSLDTTVQQLLAVGRDGDVSAEARKALPEALRDLPVKHLEELQTKVQTLLPENLRLSADSSAVNSVSNGDLTMDADRHLVVTNNEQQAQKVRQDFFQSLSVVNEQAPAASIVKQTDAQIAAQKKTEEMTKHQNPLVRFGHIVADTWSGFFGGGYSMGEIEKAKLLEAFAKSDYEGVKASLAMGARKTATTVAVGVTAVNAPIVLPVVAVGAIAGRAIANNEVLSAAVKSTVENVKDYASGVVRGFQPIPEFASHRNALAESLPKSADGGLTPQSEMVLKLVDERSQDLVETSRSATDLLP